MRRSFSLALALMIMLTAVASSNAATVQRTWTAHVGTNGANGVAVLRAYTNGTGLLSLRLARFRPATEVRIQVRAGTCANLGTVRATLYPATTSATGTVTTTRNVPEAKMNAIWKAARAGSIAIRFVAGSLVRCGTLKFAVATRVVIGRLGIDLPIIRGRSTYPPCNVALYMPVLSQPREPGVTMIYAHARRGMFLPLLRRSKIDNGASLIGMRVRVYTSDSRVSTYQIIAVRRHVRSLQSALSVTGERLWLYTSEGPNSTYPKLVVVAKRLWTTTATYRASHPRAHPVRC